MDFGFWIWILDDWFFFWTTGFLVFGFSWIVGFGFLRMFGFLVLVLVFFWMFGFSSFGFLVFPDLEFWFLVWIFGFGRSINFCYKCRMVGVAAQSRF